MSSKRWIFTLAAAAALTSTAPAQAAPVTLCMREGAAITAPASDGSCRMGYTATDAASDADLRAARDQIAALKADLNIARDRIALLEGDLNVARDQIAALTDNLTEARSRIGTMETLLTGVSRTEDTLLISGVDVQIVNGTGDTRVGNARGNLILGYNEGAGEQSGSHNLIIGRGHTAIGSAGIVAGAHNELIGEFSVVLGEFNTAEGFVSAVTGGSHNTARGQLSAVTGGIHNRAEGLASAILGGEAQTVNTAFGTYPAGP